MNTFFLKKMVSPLSSCFSTAFIFDSRKRCLAEPLPWDEISYIVRADTIVNVKNKYNNHRGT